jgi:hypothetical protein
MRCGSDATLIRTEIPMDWNAAGTQIAEEGKRGIRLFVIDRFDDPTPATITIRLKSEPGFDGLDGTIESSTAETLQQMAMQNGCTFLLTTVAGKESQIHQRRIARHFGKEQGQFIALEQDRPGDDWYTATVTCGAVEHRYGPLYFSSECPDPTQPQLESRLVPDSDATPTSFEKGRRPWYRRLFGVNG